MQNQNGTICLTIRADDDMFFNRHTPTNSWCEIRDSIELITALLQLFGAYVMFYSPIAGYPYWQMAHKFTLAQR